MNTQSIFFKQAVKSYNDLVIDLQLTTDYEEVVEIIYLLSLQKQALINQYGLVVATLLTSYSEEV